LPAVRIIDCRPPSTSTPPLLGPAASDAHSRHLIADLVRQYANFYAVRSYCRVNASSLWEARHILDGYVQQQLPSHPSHPSQSLPSAQAPSNPPPSRPPTADRRPPTAPRTRVHALRGAKTVDSSPVAIASAHIASPPSWNIFTFLSLSSRTGALSVDAKVQYFVHTPIVLLPGPSRCSSCPPTPVFIDPTPRQRLHEKRLFLLSIKTIGNRRISRGNTKPKLFTNRSIVGRLWEAPGEDTRAYLMAYCGSWHNTLSTCRGKGREWPCRRRISSSTASTGPCRKSLVPWDSLTLPLGPVAGAQPLPEANFSAHGAKGASCGRPCVCVLLCGAAAAWRGYLPRGPYHE
jgi:hypothetical protein